MGGSLTWRILWELGLARLKAFSEVLVKDDQVIVRKNDRDVCIMHGMVRTHSVTDARHGDGLSRALTDFRRDPIDKLELFRVDDERVWERREAAPPRMIFFPSQRHVTTPLSPAALTVSPRRLAGSSGTCIRGTRRP